MWLATEEGWLSSVAWSHAGHLFSFEWAQTWWTNVPKDEWPDEVSKIIEDNTWSEEYGDRHQEIVLIGLQMNKDAVRKALDMTLLTDEELSSEVWKKSHYVAVAENEPVIVVAEPKGY